MDEKTKLITMAVCGVVISAALIASFFAISFTQQAVAQGNTTGGGNATSASKSLSQNYPPIDNNTAS